MTPEQLKMLQGLPLEEKVSLSLSRIDEWYKAFDGKVYVGYSGGKDSTVLLNLVRKIHKNVLGLFCDTGLEYPEVVAHVKDTPRVLRTSPRMSFREVVGRFGYPVVSKRVSELISFLQNPTNRNEATRHLALTGTTLDGKVRSGYKLSSKYFDLVDSGIKISSRCCGVMKKGPSKLFESKYAMSPMLGTMAVESSLRLQHYLGHECNSFDSKRPMSTPMGFWTEQDILQYIKQNNLKIPEVYGSIVGEDGNLGLTGVDRTGCMFCLFGITHQKGLNKFQRMKETHPKIHKYCTEKLECGRLMDILGVPYN